MKTRSNMPLYVVECEDVKALSNSQIDLLRCGDYLVKKDASGEHAYKVTFKSDTGLCLTYHDAYCVETQSYDKVDGNWVYNSEDKTIIAEPSFENIVDKDGHPRFIEGEVNLNAGLPAGVVKTYGKWSLSGTHLQIVLGGTIADGTVLNVNSIISIIEIPVWIYNKLKPLYSTALIPYTDMPLYAEDGTNQSFNCRLFKSNAEGKIQIGLYGLTLTKDRLFRINFDLLIDNE